MNNWLLVYVLIGIAWSIHVMRCQKKYYYDASLPRFRVVVSGVLNFLLWPACMIIAYIRRGKHLLL